MRAEMDLAQDFTVLKNLSMHRDRGYHLLFMYAKTDDNPCPLLV